MRQAPHLPGFSDVTGTTVSSQSVPAGQVVDIRTRTGQSVIQRNITAKTPVVLVVSRGPAG